MAVKQLGKKGMFLTFIAVSLIAALIIIFTPSDITLSMNTQAIRTRVLNTNEYVLDLENVYLERTLQATGRKTIIALIEYMEAETISTGTEVFFSNVEGNPLYFEDVFSEVLLDGTIEGVDIDDYYDKEIMTDNTYKYWLGKVNTTAEETLNIYTDYDVSSIKVYQITPWMVNVEANILFNVSSETSSWNKTATIITEIEIENLDDPYYLVKTGGVYYNKINKSNVKFDEWSVKNVTDHINSGTYVHWENSGVPSFLMRFLDDATWNDPEFDAQKECCGIESIVNPDNPAILNQYTSYADYLYWTTTSDCVNLVLYTADGIDPEIKFDFNHLALYNRTANAEKICPPPE